MTIAVDSLKSASLTWNATGGNGTWSTSNANWWNGSSNVLWSQSNNTTATDEATFAGLDGNYTITLGTQIATGNLTFSNSGYTLTGSELFIPNNGTITVAANKTATISSKTLGLANTNLNMTVNVGSTLNLSGGHSATTGATSLGAQFRMQGAGTLNMSAGEYYTPSIRLDAGALNQTGGNLLMTGTTGSMNLNYGAGRDVTYTLSGGSLRMESHTSNSSQTGMHLTIGRDNGNNVGKLALQSGGNITIGANSGAVLNIVGKSSNANGWLDVQGGNLTVGTANAISQIYFFADGANAGKNATMTQSGGTVTTQGIQFGGTTGTYNATANATLQLTGGSLYVGSSGITRGSGNASVLTPNIVLSGGTLGASANWTSSLGMRIGSGVTTIQAGNITGTAFNITLSGNLSNVSGQTGSLAKSGNGTLSLSGANTYNGTTTLSAGTLAVNSATAIGSSALTIAGGALDNTSGTAITLSNNNAQNWNGDFTFAGTSDLNLGAGAVAMNASRIVTVTAGNLTVGGSVSGSGFGLTKNGSGSLILSGANTYNGATTINAGTLSLASGGSIGTSSSNMTLANGAVLRIGSGAVVNASANMSVRGNSTILLQGGGQFNVGTASSTVVFTSDNSVGVVNNTLGSSGALGAGGNMTVTGSFLRPAASNSQSYTFTFDNVNVNASGATFEVGRGGSLNTVTITNNAVVTAANTTMSVDARDYNLHVSNGGRLVLSGTLALASGSSTGANNTININGGQVTGATSLSFLTSANSTNARVNVLNGGLLSTGGSTVNGTGTLVSVNGTGSHWNLGSATLTLGTMNSTVLVSNGGQITAGSVNAGAGAGNFTFDNGSLVAGANGSLTSSVGVFGIRSGGATIDTGLFTLTVSANLTEDAGSAGGGLTKNGSGTLTLNGINTYTGATTISGGNLSFSTTAALASTSGLSMATATALIYTGGAATLNRDISVTGGTGTIRNSGTGLLTLSGGLSKNGTTLTLAGGSNGITVSGLISGSANNSDLVIDGGTTTLTNANNSYNGPTFIINSGTLNANTAGALPTSTLTAVTINGSSTLALGASQSVASLSGTSGSSVNLNANTLTINGSSSTTYSGGISGTGNLVKNGTGTQTLAGATTFNGTTTVNSGTLQAATANALANTSNIDLNGGSFLVTAENAVNDSANINLNSGTLAVSGTFNENVGLLTLSANSVIDLNGFTGILRFGGVGSWASNTTLAIWNWNGTPQYNENNAPYSGGTRHVVFASNSGLEQYLDRISFYSGSGSGFVGNAFEDSFSQSGLTGTEIIAVPEPETYLTGFLLLLGFGIYQLSRLVRQGRGLLARLTLLLPRAHRKPLEGQPPA